MESDIDTVVDRLISQQSHTKKKRGELVEMIHPDIFFKFNSVNLVIGRRGSGKTHMVLREILKCKMLGIREYTQVWYVTDKERDDTYEKLEKLLEDKIQLNWITTKEAPQLLDVLEKGKANLAEHPEFRECLNCEDLPPSIIPHTFIVFDDCIGLFSRTTALAKKLYQTRQSRVTAFLMMQDVQGLNPSMKANVDSLILFGGFPKHKFCSLFYQLPPVDFSYEQYWALRQQDYALLDFVDGDVNIVYRQDN